MSRTLSLAGRLLAFQIGQCTIPPRKQQRRGVQWWIVLPTMAALFFAIWKGWL